VLVQTRRHSYLCHLLGIRNIVLAVNKMDLVGYDQGVFDAIVADYASFAQTIGITDFVAMPISGFCGNNITTGSDQTPWYTGPALIEHLETVEVDTAQGCGPPVPYAGAVGQSSQSRFPRLCGLIASGSIHPGDAVRVLPSGKTSTVERIVTLEGDPPKQSPGSRSR
jgi:bifunctional enzyme CysN/CysC